MFTYKPLSGFKHFFFFKPCDDSNWLSHFRAGVKSQAESSSSSSSSLAEVAYGHVKDSQSISDRCKTNRKRGTAAAARVKAQTFEDWRPLPIAWWEAPQLSGGPPVHWNLCLNGLCCEVCKNWVVADCTNDVLECGSMTLFDTSDLVVTVCM